MKAYVVFRWEPYESCWPEKYFLDSDKASLYCIEAEAAEEDRVRSEQKRFGHPAIYLRCAQRNQYEFEEIEVIE